MWSVCLSSANRRLVELSLPSWVFDLVLIDLVFKWSWLPVCTSTNFFFLCSVAIWEKMSKMCSMPPLTTGHVKGGKEREDRDGFQYRGISYRATTKVKQEEESGWTTWLRTFVLGSSWNNFWGKGWR